MIQGFYTSYATSFIVENLTKKAVDQHYAHWVQVSIDNATRRGVILTSEPIYRDYCEVYKDYCERNGLRKETFVPEVKPFKSVFLLSTIHSIKSLGSLANSVESIARLVIFTGSLSLVKPKNFSFTNEVKRVFLCSANALGIFFENLVDTTESLIGINAPNTAISVMRRVSGFHRDACLLMSNFNR